MRLKASLMNEAKMRRTIINLAHIMLADNANAERIALVGIGSRGYSMAREMSAIMQAEGSLKVPFARMDPTFDADVDAATARELGFCVGGVTIIIVNDLLRSGRTVFAASDAIVRAGAPSAVRLAVLIDGSNDSALMRANYVGLKTSLNADDIVSVSVKDVDGERKVEVYNV